MTLYNVFGGGEMLLRGENVGLEYREIFCTGKWYFGLEWKVVGRGKMCLWHAVKLTSSG